MRRDKHTIAADSYSASKDFKMKTIVLLLLISFTVCQSWPQREAKQFSWLWGNSKAEATEIKSKPNSVRANLRQNPQVLQRRTNQFVNEIQGNGIGNYQKYPPQPVLNRKYQVLPQPSQNKKGLRRPQKPPPQRTQQRVEQNPVDQRKVLMPVIISSYASTNIQGRGNDDQKRIKEAVEKYEKLNEISYEIKSVEINSDDVEEADITEIKENYDDRVQAKVEELVVEKINNNDILILGVDNTIEDIKDIKEVTTIEIFTSTEQLITTTSATTTQYEIEENSSEFVTDSPFSNEISEYEGRSPYLPEIPEKLDEEIHGTPEEKLQLIVKENIPENYLAGYKQVEPIQPNNGNDRTEQNNLNQQRDDRPVQTTVGKRKQEFFPLGKPTLRPPFKKLQQQKIPEESQENSFFDFLPFWKSSEKAKPKRPLPPPRRPIGPTVTKLQQKPQADYPKGLQAPLLLKVGSTDSQISSKRISDSKIALKTKESQYPAQETPERPEIVDEPSDNARIDNTIHTELENKPQDAFIVLPVKENKPQRHIQNHAPKQVLNYPARSNARPPQRINQGPPQVRRPPPPQRYPQRPSHQRVNNNRPLPMLSQPVIGLPQVPASRKQSPFIAKRPPLPPQLPASYPGAPKPPQKKKFQQKPQFPRIPVNKPLRPTIVPKKPNNKIFKKLESFTPKVIEKQQKLSAPSKVQDSNPFDFKPNGSKKPTSDIASHLSSLLNSFFSTTASPAPAPSLPSLVEDTEFADIVNGYKASDEDSKVEKTELKNPPTTKVPVIKSEESPFDDLDSLSAPSLGNKFQPKKNVFLKTKPKVFTTTQVPTTQATTRSAPTSASTSAPTTTQVTSTSTTRRPIVSSTTTQVFVPREETTTIFISPIQELVNEYQKKGHVVPQNQYPEPVLKAIQKNFEHKKNIFEQFVSFEENDKAFVPNKEAYSSDWSRGPISLSDKLLVYQTFPPTDTTLVPSTLPPQTSTVKYALAKNSPSFPDERNAEGGFRPMLRPLHSPLLN